MLIPAVRKTLQLLLRDDRPIVVFDTANDVVNHPTKRDPDHPPLVAGDPGQQREIGDGPQQYTVRGYRQTSKAAFAGGKANGRGVRVRNAGMRALARTFKGQPFISGHDWEDVRARGGTIKDARIEEIDDGAELAILYDIEAVTAWAKEGFANGMIDRFSFGIDLAAGAEIICTAHGAPVWSMDDCMCFPGEMVSIASKDEPDHPPLVGVAEWEYENAVGHELSGVNVPAVDGTGVLNSAARSAPILMSAQSEARQVALLATLAGRVHPRLAALAAEGGYSPKTSRRTMTPCSTSDRSKPMDRALICKMLGLAANATDEEIAAKLSANASSTAQVAALQQQLAENTERERARTAELDAAHIESEITRLTAAYEISEKTLANLRAAAKDPIDPKKIDRKSFDATVVIVEAAAPKRSTGRPALQSDAAAAVTAGAGSPNDAVFGDAPDAFEQNKTNQELPKLMRFAKLSIAQVREHGAREFNVVPNLQELINNSTEEPSAVMKVQAYARDAGK